MRTNLLIVAAIAAAFAASCAHTNRDRTASTSSTAVARSDGGAEAMFRGLDRNNDGFISRDEAQGTPHARDFDALDTNRDGRLSRAEHAAAPEHARSAAAPMGDQRAAAPGTGGPGGSGGSTSSRY
jgi:EF hand domain-containing protein